MIFVGQIVFDLWTLMFLKIVEILVLALSIYSKKFKNVNVHKSKTI